MRISSIEPLVVDGSFRNWVFVLVRTTEGAVGLGEATLEGRENAVVGAISDFTRRLLGNSANEVRRLTRLLARDGYWERGPVISSAIGGIEMALWDLIGKAHGEPVAGLFGGAFQTRIPVYSNAWYFGAQEPAELADRAAATVEAGYRALKIDPFGRADVAIRLSELRSAVQRIEAMRSAVGFDVELMIEGHGRFSSHSAVRVARALEEFEPLFFEEPVRPHDYEALKVVAAQTSIPLATGERCYDVRECAAAIASGAVSVLQPDIIHVGGFIPLFRIADMCADAQILIAPHNASGPIATAGTLQASACFPNLLLQEMFVPADAPWKEAVVGPAPVIQDGMLQVPSLPGLGIELNETEAQRHPFVPRDLDMMGSDSILEQGLG